MKHLIKLGLRSPSEMTHARICALLYPGIFEDLPSERFGKLTEVKKLVKGYCEASPKCCYLEQLPANVRDLQEFASIQSEFVPSRIEDLELLKLVRSIPLRSSNKMTSSRLVPTAPTVPTGAADLMSMMFNMMQMAAVGNQERSTGMIPRLQILQPSQHSQLHQAVQRSRSLLALPAPGTPLEETASPPPFAAVAPGVQPGTLSLALKDADTQESSANDKRGMDPVEVAKMLGEKRALKRPAAAVEKQQGGEGKSESKKQKQDAVKKSKHKKAESQPLPSKNERLKMMPKGCSRCRWVPGCCDSCWKRRAPYKS